MVSDETRLLGAGRVYLAGPIADAGWLPDAFTAPRAERHARYLSHADPLERFSVLGFV